MRYLVIVNSRSHGGAEKQALLRSDQYRQYSLGVLFLSDKNKMKIKLEEYSCIAYLFKSWIYTLRYVGHYKINVCWSIRSSVLRKREILALVFKYFFLPRFTVESNNRRLLLNYPVLSYVLRIDYLPNIYSEVNVCKSDVSYDFEILIYSRFVRVKNIELAIEKALMCLHKKGIPSSQLLVAGYGDLGPVIEALQVRYGFTYINTSNSQFILYRGIAKYLFSFSLFEGSSNVIHEALSHGILPIVSNVGDNHLMVVSECILDSESLESKWEDINMNRVEYLHNSIKKFNYNYGYWRNRA